jgi:hypothetical protein
VATVADELEELLACARVVADHAGEAAGGQARARRVHPAHGHAAVLGFDDDADALGLQDLLNRLGDFRRQLLLDLQAARKAVDDAGQLGDADDAVVRQIAHMGPAQERQHVVLAEAHHADVAQHHQLVVAADLVEGPLEIFAGIHVVAREQLLVGARDTAGGVQQALAVGVVPRPFDQSADGGFGLFLGDFPALFVRHDFLRVVTPQRYAPGQGSPDR